MTTFNNLQTTEPAFISNEKYARAKGSRCAKLLCYSCYSLSNLALILFCLLGGFFSGLFLYDDTLYENSEHLLGVKFYRQIIFVMIVFTILLLVPLFNGVGACFLTGRNRTRDLDKALLGVKIIYILVLIVLIFISLAFIAPTMRSSSVAIQLNYEILRHLQRRYTSDFSFMLTDQLQEQYKCCDELWYRANYSPNNLPPSCYHVDGTYLRFHDRNCAEVLGELVGDRCTVIAISLVASLLALVILVCIIVAEIVSGHHYNVDRRESMLTGASKTASNPEDPEAEPLEQSSRLTSNSPTAGDRLSSDSPLVKPTNSIPDPFNTSVYQPTTVPLITRAHFLHNRPQSPTYLNQSQNQNQKQQQQQQQPLVKSSLKKTSSIQRIDSSSEDERQSISSNHLTHNEPIQHIISGQLTRDTQTRRSTLSVRFAD